MCAETEKQVHNSSSCSIVFELLSLTGSYKKITIFNKAKINRIKEEVCVWWLIPHIELMPTWLVRSDLNLHINS